MPRSRCIPSVPTTTGYSLRYTRAPANRSSRARDDAQKAAFVHMQFDAKHAQYQEHYAGASFDIILVDGQTGRATLRQARHR
jgi:hypothetical protein